MKRKSIVTICAIALMLVLSLSVLTACNKDGKHNFAEAWSNDETYHWHAIRFSICETNFELLPNLISCLLLHILLYVFSF